MNLQVDIERVLLANKAVRAELLAERTGDGHWVGQLASSPLATAAATSALVVAHRRDTQVALHEKTATDGQLIEHIVQCDLSELLLKSVHWLARHQNPDGGWGDCDRARSNIAATMMVQAAFRLTGIPAKYSDLMVRADDYVEAQGGVAGLWRQYGKDRTYVASVLANCAMAGMVPWRQVPTLRFELLCLPKRWQQQIQPPAPRYATPAFVAVGRGKLHHDPPRNPFTRLLRQSFRAKSLALLERLQASDGGFVDCMPQTAFVVMSLASIGCQDHPLVQRGIEFLLSAVRADASWSVGSNLATSNTTFALNHLVTDQPNASTMPAQLASQRPLENGRIRSTSARLAAPWADTARVGDEFADTAATEREGQTNGQILLSLEDDQFVLDERCLDWLLDSQHTVHNAVTEAPSGGWARNDLPGALPNTDDTSRALLALFHWRRRFAQLHCDRIERAAKRGVAWLLDLQNEDGGWPTFYREAGSPVFERGGADVTAQSLSALFAWKRLWEAQAAGAASTTSSPSLPAQIGDAIQRGLRYLEVQQRDDGSYVPVWFGNEHHPGGHNPVVGTAVVLEMCRELGLLESEMALHAARWLVTAQHASGGWGPPRAPLDYSGTEKDGFRAWRGNEAMATLCSVEETAMAVSALLPLAETNHACARAVSHGLTWLAGAIERDAHRQAAVLGFYLAKIWYHERLYPLVFAAGALSQAARQLEPQPHVAAQVS